MAKRFAAIEDVHRRFIRRQHIFFVASAAGHGHVNVSPRSTSLFRLLGGNRVAYLDLTGSGNETAAHIRAGGRVTIMFCAFEGPPLILRLYGPAAVLHRNSDAFARMVGDHFDGVVPPGGRQIVTLEADLVQTSCGYAVPFHDYKAERDTLDTWAAGKSADDIDAYWREKNQTSLDGLPTGLFEGAP